MVKRMIIRLYESRVPGSNPGRSTERDSPPDEVSSIPLPVVLKFAAKDALARYDTSAIWSVRIGRGRSRPATPCSHPQVRCSL